MSALHQVVCWVKMPCLLTWICSDSRSHGALCAVTALDMKEKVPEILFGGGKLGSRTRIQCIVKSTFSETRLVPALNDMLIANPSPGKC